MIFFWVFFTFQMILNNGCLTSEQKKWNCLHCTSPTPQNNDLFIHFLTFLPGSGSANLCGSESGQGKNMRIRADPDPDPKPWLEVKEYNWKYANLCQPCSDMPARRADPTAVSWIQSVHSLLVIFLQAAPFSMLCTKVMYKTKCSVILKPPFQ